MFIRPAKMEDARPVATILAEAFPNLYRSTFGKMTQSATVDLLQGLFVSGHLCLGNTQLAVQDAEIVGVMILHFGESIGRGTIRDYLNFCLRHAGWIGAFRIFFGGLLTNHFLGRRIPRAADLVYIEALAVSETQRGKGIGSELLREAERFAKERSRKRIALHVMNSNEDAHRLYLRFGFRPWRSPPVPSAWMITLLVRALDD